MSLGRMTAPHLSLPHFLCCLLWASAWIHGYCDVNYVAVAWALPLSPTYLGCQSLWALLSLASAMPILHSPGASQFFKESPHWDMVSGATVWKLGASATWGCGGGLRAGFLSLSPSLSSRMLALTDTHSYPGPSFLVSLIYLCLCHLWTTLLPLQS